MRIAVVSPYSFDAFGGVQDQVALLVGQLRAAGDEAWAVAPGSGGPSGTRHVGRVTAVRANRSRAPIGLMPGTARRVREALSGAQVVHVHEPLMPAVSIAALLGSPVPVVATFHADPSRVVRGLYRAGAGLLRRLVRRAAVVTAVSPVAAGAVRPFAEARIVPNGIVTAGYAPGGPPAAGRVVFLGRDDPRKGLDVLLAAWPAVRRAVPGAHLRVIGTMRDTGPEGVEFLGRLDEESKRAELREASVLCAPNLGGESFGITLAEGMAAGCAVVASDLPAFRAVLGDAGVLSAPGDGAALAGALSGLLADAGEIERLGAAARHGAARFDAARVAAAYANAYRDAAGSSR